MNGSQQSKAAAPFAASANKQSLSFVECSSTGAFVAPHLLHAEGGRLSLRGSCCAACGELYFPVARGCTRCCGTTLNDVPLGDRGRLWSWTVQGFCPKPPYDGAAGEAFMPYGVGYVELDNGLKVESRLTVAEPTRLRIGLPMRLVLEAYALTPDGEPLHTFAFEPDEAAR